VITIKQGNGENNKTRNRKTIKQENGITIQQEIKLTIKEGNRKTRNTLVNSKYFAVSLVRMFTLMLYDTFVLAGSVDKWAERSLRV